MKNESWFPLGIPWKQERFLLWTGLLLSAGAGLVLFLCQYLPARRALYGYNGTMGPGRRDGARVLLPAPWCPPFPACSMGRCSVFWRWPSPWPRWPSTIFSATTRAAGASTGCGCSPSSESCGGAACPPPPWPLLLGAALTAAVILLCALCYYHLTPAGHLPPEPWGGLPLGWIGGNHA